MFYVAFRCVVVASSFRTERYNITGALISDAIMTQRKASGLRMDQSELDYELFYLSEIYLFHTDGLSLDVSLSADRTPCSPSSAEPSAG